MTTDLWALLVYDKEYPVCSIERLLLSQGMRTRHSRNCSEARVALRESPPLAVVLTDTSLPDGTWADVLEAASAALAITPVFVVSRIVDIRLYLDVLEKGAHDFIVPPISSEDLSYLIKIATQKCSHRALQNMSKQSTPAGLSMTHQQIGQKIGASCERVP